MNDFAEIIRNVFPARTVVVVGDLVADQFLRGTIARVSREAPVFILRHDETETLPGGAANAAANVASLGGRAKLVGVVGNDRNGDQLMLQLERSAVDSSGVVRADGFQTTTKVRVLAGQHYAQRQQVIRIDYENQNELAPEIHAQIHETLATACADADAIILSDYNYGVASRDIFDAAREIAGRRGIPLVVDSRFGLENYPDATSATPNQEEVEKIIGPDFDAADVEDLARKLGYEALLVTRGNKGMILIERNRPPLFIKAVGSSEPVDVTGAGDTVIAVYALGLASGLSHAESASIANCAGGLVVMKKGTATVAKDELLTAAGRIEPPATQKQTL